jgi:hypothetical protein
MQVIVDLSAAVICFLSACYPTLVGKNTPVGEFSLVEYSTTENGYGGNLLVFKEVGGEFYAVHRVLDIPGQQRLARIKSPKSDHRINVTDGCINVENDVFDKLVDCCRDWKIVIK